MNKGRSGRARCLALGVVAACGVGASCSDRPVPERLGDGQSGDPCETDLDCAIGSVCFNEVCVQEGIFRVSLSWEVVSDFDLHVRTPGGSEISYAISAADGGYLDVDDCVGGECANPGGTHVENIFFNAMALPGTYRVWVVNFDGRAAGPFQIEVAGAVSQQWSGMLPAAEGSQSSTFAFEWGG